MNIADVRRLLTFSIADARAEGYTVTPLDKLSEGGKNCCVIGSLKPANMPYPSADWFPAACIGELEAASIMFGFDGEGQQCVDMPWEMYTLEGEPLPAYVALGREFRREAGF